MSLVCLDCHTIALCTGSPVRLSQSTVVSRWLEMPMAATWSGCRRALWSTSAITAMVSSQMDSASCPTQPGSG